MANDRDGAGAVAPMRLQKFLSAAGFCSRRKGEVFIREGRIAVNGHVVTELGTRVDPAGDRVTADGVPLRLSQSSPVTIALNKPKGVITSCHHGDARVVTDLVNLKERLYPVGRLDRDSTGLLLLTNDGRLHHRLSHPSFDHEKEYRVETIVRIPDGALRKLAAGIALQGRKTRRAEVQRLSATTFRIVLKEGRNRQIRRMVTRVGSKVRFLHRIRIANVRLGRLPEGQWRHLGKKEKRELYARVGIQ